MDSRRALPAPTYSRPPQHILADHYVEHVEKTARENARRREAPEAARGPPPE